MVAHEGFDGGDEKITVELEQNDNENLHFKCLKK